MVRCQLMYWLTLGNSRALSYAAHPSNTSTICNPYVDLERVSTAAGSGIAATGEYRSATVQQLTEAEFNVLKTGKNPYHYTVQLPEPVTPQITNTLNTVLGGEC